MIILAIFIGIVGLAVCLMDWRKGLFICIAVGFLQDPFRKLVHGEPIFLTLLVGIFVTAVVLGALIQRGPLSFTPIHAWYGVLRIPLIAFVLLVVLQASRTFMRYGNPLLAIIGTFSYLIPLIAILVTYYYPKGIENTKRLAAFYIGMCAIAASGVYLGFLGSDWPVLQQVGPGLRIYDFGMIMNAYPGFLRSPEIMAWHAATGICTLVVLLTLTRKPSASFLCGILIIFLLIAGILTGRRKILVEIVLFLTFFAFLLMYFRKKVRSFFTFGLLIGGIGAALIVKMVIPQEAVGHFHPYWQRGMTVFADAPGRFDRIGLGSVEWAFHRGGIFGIGAGTGSQGAQHFGGGWAMAGGALEGGLGKITVELGIPGLILALWLAIGLGLYSWRILANVQRGDPQFATATYGLVAFLAANIPIFMSASQVYGDPFVLLVLGSLLGFLLSVPRLVGLQTVSKDVAKFHGPNLSLSLPRYSQERYPRSKRLPFRSANRARSETKTCKSCSPYHFR